VARGSRQGIPSGQLIATPRAFLFLPLHPREFSIASASRAHPHEVHLCAAIVDYKARLKRGMGTFFLTSLPIGAKPYFALFPITLNHGVVHCTGIHLRIGITKRLLALSQDLTTPVIYIGPGTGVAPAWAVLEVRMQRVRGTTLYTSDTMPREKTRTNWLNGHRLRNPDTSRIALRFCGTGQKTRSGSMYNTL
jgi:sulfite reductase alpha subunit-like flavoprotein